MIADGVFSATGGIRRDEGPDTVGSGQEVHMPPQRRMLKRGASHVYIAHMIEELLHMERCGHYARLLLVLHSGSSVVPLYGTDIPVEPSP